MHKGVRPIRRRPPTGVGLWRDKSGKRSPANGGMSSTFTGGLCCTLIYKIKCESRPSGTIRHEYRRTIGAF